MEPLAWHLFLVLVFLCWGSFLNLVGHRLIQSISIISPRSRCPHCFSDIAWHDNIPIISWIILRGSCRSCSEPISPLYPAIELFSACAFLALYHFVPPHYFFAYFIFFSALIVTIRSDLEYMLISRMVTIFLIPIGIGLSFTEYLPISWREAILGSIIGYYCLYATTYLFKRFTGKVGMGEGDFDLLAFIGSFVGPFGCWATLLIGSTIGSIIGIIYLITTGAETSQKIPFGPFLALGAIIFVLFQEQIFNVFFFI